MPGSAWRIRLAALHGLAMVLRALAFVLPCLCLVGCAAPSAEEGRDEEITDENALGSLPSVLRAQTALARMRTLDPQSGAVSVRYAPPAGAPEYPSRPKFEAVTFEAEAGTSSEVAVTGDFPSSATVVVTNDRFEPLAAARTVRSSVTGLSSATLHVPADRGPQMVLVRDPLWVKPMTFAVSVQSR